MNELRINRFEIKYAFYMNFIRQISQHQTVIFQGCSGCTPRWKAGNQNEISKFNLLTEESS